MTSSQLKKRNLSKPSQSHVTGKKGTEERRGSLMSLRNCVGLVLIGLAVGTLGFNIYLQSLETKQTTVAPIPSKEEFSAANDVYYNERDKLIVNHLRRGFALLEKSQISKSLKHFENTLEKHPDSPATRFGVAMALDRLADERRSNTLLQKAIDTYSKVVDAEDCPKELAYRAFDKTLEKCNFLGRSKTAIAIAERMASLYPNDIKILSKLGVQLLIVGRNKQSMSAFEQVLKLDPNNGFAKSHVAFVLKSELKYNESIQLFEEGVNSGHEGADDARFYFHLGDAYTRTGRREEAKRVYAEAAAKGHFMSALQRSLYNADTPLKAQPWWDPADTPYASNFKKLEARWEMIRDEGLSVLDMKSGGFMAEEENLRETGDWLQFTLFQQGRKVVENCRKTPKTCALLDSMADASGCKRGQVKYSIMHAGTHIWPHCGPTNCRIRSHLGLIIPDDVAIRCGQETRTWQEGKVIIIDDSFDHEVWHNGTSLRLIFIVDFWHPDLTKKQRNSLSPI